MDPPIAANAFPKIAAHAFCDGFGACCSKANVGFDTASCVTRSIANWNAQFAALPATQKYDPSAAERCIANLLEVARNCGPSSEPNHSCDWDLFPGTLPAGSPCKSGADCKQPATCTGDPQICVATPPAKLGEACAGNCGGNEGSSPGDCYGVTDATNAVCYSDQSLICTDGTCQAIPDPDGTVDIGGACSDAMPCKQGLYCNTASNRCAARKHPFSACTRDDECIEPPCTKGQCAFGQTDACTGQSSSSN